MVQFHMTGFEQMYYKDKCTQDIFLRRLLARLKLKSGKFRKKTITQKYQIQQVEHMQCQIQQVENTQGLM